MKLAPPLETVVYDPATGAASHIKVLPYQISGSPPAIAFDFAAAARASLAERDKETQEMQARESELQQALCQFEPGAALDKTTPTDGHCLFHALNRGGLIQPGATSLD